jgi:ribosomal-protein-alanine N-acetyltransferase
VIETHRLVLRSFEPADAQAFAGVLADERTMAPWGGPYDIVAAEHELNNYIDHLTRYGFAPFAILLGGALVGDMGLQRLEGGEDIELVYRFSSSVWGRGLATEAGDAALGYSFSVLGLEEVVAVIAEDNRPSQRLAARLGFVPGALGIYYGKSLVRHRVTPQRHASALAARTPTTIES